jgi:hypothetical protein
MVFSVLQYVDSVGHFVLIDQDGVVVRCRRRRRVSSSS